MIIDINAHLGHYPFRQLRHNTTDGLLALMDASGIDKAVVSSLNSVFYRDAHTGNEELAEAAENANGRFIPLATINPKYAGWERDLDQAVSEWQMKGIRLVPQYHDYQLTDEHGQAILTAAVERQIPVAIPQRLEDRRQRHHFDAATDLSLDGVLRAVQSHSELKLIFLNWLSISEDTLKEAGLCDRILIDLTRIPILLVKTLPTLIVSVGIQAIAFGTHIPLNYPGPPLVKLEIMEVTEEDRERIAWRNAVEFLGLEER